MAEAAYKIEAWKAEARPYCVLRFSEAKRDYIPHRKQRFATVADALTVANRLDRGRHFTFVDFASAHQVPA